MAYKQRLWTEGLIVLLMLAVVASALGVTYTKFLSRKTFAELQQEYYRRDQLQTEWNQLLLEESSLSTSARIEQLARQKLSMVRPRFSGIEVVADE